MSKYFVRYSYNITSKVPHGDGLGWKHETEQIIDVCIFEIPEEYIEISEVRNHILHEELKYVRPEAKPSESGIDILVLNRL